MMMMDAEVRRVIHLSDEYNAELDLRDRVLRRPIGLSIQNDDLSREGDEIHLGAFCEAELIGCLILAPLPQGDLRVRQVAVDEAFRGKGVGTRLMQECERIARKLGCRSVVLHARRTAVPFYEKLGYTAQGEGFTEVGIPHRAMRKLL